MTTVHAIWFWPVFQTDFLASRVQGYAVLLLHSSFYSAPPSPFLLSIQKRGGFVHKALFQDRDIYLKDNTLQPSKKNEAKEQLLLE